jgi:hypothetical protein
MGAKTLLIDDCASMSSQVLGEDEAVLVIGDRRLVLNYDSAYELAFRMAALISEMAAKDKDTYSLQ